MVPAAAPYGASRIGPPQWHAKQRAEPGFILGAPPGTGGGFFDAGGCNKSLGHMFMPLQSAWNSGSLVWSEAQAHNWTNRAAAAGGAWHASPHPPDFPVPK